MIETTEASPAAQRIEWVAVNGANELFGVDVLRGANGLAVGHAVVKRHRHGGVEVLARYTYGQGVFDTFGAARADAVLASALPVW